NAQVFDAMTDALARRGPDGRGTWRDGSVAFGHRRLAIIETSSAGAQPMLSHDERYVLCFNGEIYNYVTLRTQLQALGHTFRTRSDSEVILEGYRAWGDDVVKRLNGIFA